jgi:hypothetical protein
MNSEWGTETEVSADCSAEPELALKQTGNTQSTNRTKHVKPTFRYLGDSDIHVARLGQSLGRYLHTGSCPARRSDTIPLLFKVGSNHLESLVVGTASMQMVATHQHQ